MGRIDVGEENGTADRILPIAEQPETLDKPTPAPSRTEKGDGGALSPRGFSLAAVLGATLLQIGG